MPPPTRRRSPNPLRVDPSRTAALRRMLAADLNRRLASVGQALTGLLVADDALGLGRWGRLDGPGKVEALLGWLAEQTDRRLLAGSWWTAYTEAAYARGVARSYDEVRRAPLREPGAHAAGREEFLRSVLSRPGGGIVANERRPRDVRGRYASARVLTLAARLRQEIKGLGQVSSQKIARAVIDAIDRGTPPAALAKEIRAILHRTRASAERIARTECLPGETLVDGAVVRAVFRRLYVGPMVEVVTRQGRQFSATPNHPMLTQDGWIAAGLLKKGDNLICYRGEQNPGASCDEDVHRSPATIGEIFDSFSAVGFAERQRTGEPDFHGDGMDGEVDILCPDGELRFGHFATIGKPLAQQFLTPTGRASSGFCPRCSRLLPINQKPCLCRGSQGYPVACQTFGDEAPAYAERSRDSGQRFTSKVTLNDRGGIDIASELVVATENALREDLGSRIGPADAFLTKHRADLFLFGTNDGSNFPLGEAGQVELDNVLSVRICPFAGHVYNLETPSGYFTIDSLYTGNTVRAQADGQLDGYAALGVDGVEVQVEWVTGAGACPLCEELAGVYSVDEARGLIPAHPNCRCAFEMASVSVAGVEVDAGAGGEIDVDEPETTAVPDVPLDEPAPWEAPPPVPPAPPTTPAPAPPEPGAAGGFGEPLPPTSAPGMQGARLRAVAAGEGSSAARAEMARNARDVGPVQAHGMARPERMREVVIDGVRYVYPADREAEFLARIQVTAAATGGLPPGLARSNSAIIYTTQANAADAAHAARAGVPFASGATAGDGRIVVYGSQPLELGRYAHESGHNLAKREFGATTPPPESPYGRAQAKEPPVTAYGGTSRSEDFAEACKMYVTDPAKLEREFPQKYAALEAMFQ